MKKKLLPVFLAFGFLTPQLNAQTIGTGTYVPGTYVGIGIDNVGGFEGLTLSTSSPAPATVHPRSGTGYFGFVANPQMDGWVDFNGDFFTPGTPENGWGIELGSATGTKASNNRASPLDIPGGVTNWEFVGGCYVVDWNGNYVGGGYNVGIHIRYHLKQDDLYYTTSVDITNNGTSSIPQLYYYRNVDPDNNVSLSGDYGTTNTILNQATPTCSKAVVGASQTAGPGYDPSFMGFGALGDDYRVCYGGFSNRDASDLWNFAGFTGTVGSSTFSDIAISISHRSLNVAPGQTVNIKFLTILDAAQIDEALNSYMSFEYIGALADPPSCLLNIDSAVSCSGNPLTIEFNGSIEDDFTWVWSPSTGLDTVAGNLVHAFPSDTTLYTITGTPVNPCFISTLTSQIVVIPSPGPEIVMTDPGISCIDYDLSELIFLDANNIPGTSVFFVDEAPTSAADTSIFTGTTIYPGDSVYLVISDPVSGCYDYELVDVQWGTGFSFDADIVQPICASSNGSIEIVNITGSTGVITYDWTGGPSTALYDNIPSGTYTVHMEDEAGCTGDTTINFPNITVMFSNVALDQAAECGQASGAFTVTATSGTPAYGFNIGSGIQPSGSFTGLTPGLYVIEITDQGGCLIFDSIIVPDNNTIDLSLVSVDPANCGTSNGEITVAGSGGLTPYTYSVGSTDQPTPVFSGLAPGNYYVYVTMAGGCHDSVFVTVPDNLTMTASIVNNEDAVCGEGGIIEAQAVNGGTSYTYTVGSTSQSAGLFTGLAPGVYSMTVVSGTCSQTLPFTIGDENTLVASTVSLTDMECLNPNGTAVFTASNGVPAGTYTYNVPGVGTQTNGNFSGLTQGSYSVTISSGTCSITIPFVIGFDPGNLNISLVDVTDENCGIFNGVIETQTTGGTSPLAFSNDGMVTTQTSAIFGSLETGAYVITVTDVNGCVDTLHAFVDEIPISISLGEDVLACNEHTINGMGVGDYLWSTGETTPTITVTADGTYWLNVSSNGCTDTDTVNVSLLDAPIVTPPNVFTPNGDGQNEKFVVDGVFVTTYHIKIFNRWGIEVFSGDDISASWDGKSKSGEDAPEGVYMYVIEFENPCESPAQQTRNGTIQLMR